MKGEHAVKPAGSYRRPKFAWRVGTGSLSWGLIITHNFFELSDVSISATNWCCHSYSCESTTVPLRRMSWLLRYCGPCTVADRNPLSVSRLHLPNRRIGYVLQCSK